MSSTHFIRIIPLVFTCVVNEQTLAQFTLITQREFHLDVNKLDALFPNISMETVEQAFAVFDPKNSGMVDSCELLASLVLVAPHLSREIKQKAIFELFNVSTNRIGLMVADEATLLFRTVAVGASKLHAALADLNVPSKVGDELPRLSYFEDLTKAMYGEQETLTYEAFALLCLEMEDIEAFMMPWTRVTE
ncbi:hypothetical protein V7S43_006300 [Phytophthora oleae]|uniref:EF-hand domain-containing protein n=1 Tax=Phytophthora oleae TaxID=2107226 RepID=A0ABD3FRT2_9STRA